MTFSENPGDLQESSGFFVSSEGIYKTPKRFLGEQFLCLESPILLLVIVIQAVVLKILPGFADDDAREQKQGDKVRNGHEGIDHIGEVPHEGQVDYGTHIHHHNPQQAVGPHDFRPPRYSTAFCE